MAVNIDTSAEGKTRVELQERAIDGGVVKIAYTDEDGNGKVNDGDTIVATLYDRGSPQTRTYKSLSELPQNLSKAMQNFWQVDNPAELKTVLEGAMMAGAKGVDPSAVEGRLGNTSNIFNNDIGGRAFQRALSESSSAGDRERVTALAKEYKTKLPGHCSDEEIEQYKTEALFHDKRNGAMELAETGDAASAWRMLSDSWKLPGIEDSFGIQQRQDDFRRISTISYWARVNQDMHKAQSLAKEGKHEEALTLLASVEKRIVNTENPSAYSPAVAAMKQIQGMRVAIEQHIPRGAKATTGD